jgi:hypothetical protein
MNLGLDYLGILSQAGGSLLRFGYIKCNMAGWGRDLIASEQFLGLVFVNFHF